jgi:hypothetical protein
MLTMSGIYRVLRRHRRLPVLIAVIAVIGVAALEANTIRPDHCDCVDKLCICAVSLATLGAVSLGWRRPAINPLSRRLRPTTELAPVSLLLSESAGVHSRAGPHRPLVLRR